MGQAQNKTQNNFQIFTLLPTFKIGKWYLLISKISKLCMLEYEFRRNNFPFREMLKFQMEYEIKIQESNQI
jgi:hypothetical protein